MPSTPPTFGEPIIPVIVSQHRKFALTRRCIESLRQQKGAQAYIVLLDVASPGATENELADLALLANETLYLKENVGFAAANNQAIERIAAKYPYFILLNNDTVVSENFLLSLFAFAEAHPRAAQVCPRLVYGDGTLQGVGGTIKEPLFEPGMVGNQEQTVSPHPKTANQVTFTSGCSVLVRSEAAKTVGLMAEDYFMYSEDVDWSLTFAREGWEIWYCPDTTVTHFESAGSGQYSAFKGYYLIRSHVLLARHWLPAKRWNPYTTSMRRKLLRQSVKYMRHPRYVLAMWRGFRDALNQSRKIPVGDRLHPELAPRE